MVRSRFQHPAHSSPLLCPAYSPQPRQAAQNLALNRLVQALDLLDALGSAWSSIAAKITAYAPERTAAMAYDRQSCAYGCSRYQDPGLNSLLLCPV